MDWPSAVAVIGGIASVCGLAYAIHYARTTRREKLLTYEVSLPMPIAEVVAPEDGIKIAITQLRHNASSGQVERVYVTFVRIANLGKKPIRSADIAPGNPLRVRIEESTVLNVSLVDSTRAVINLRLGNQADEADQYEEQILFDFLDCRDGGVIKILTADKEGKISILGDIIGMPTGIRVEESRSRDWYANMIGSMGCPFGLATVAWPPLLYYYITGDASRVWLFFVPLLGFYMIIGVFGSFYTVLSARTAIPFPRQLAFPEWFSPRGRDVRNRTSRQEEEVRDDG